MTGSLDFWPERHFFLPILLSVAELYDRVGISSVMKRSLEGHIRYGLPSAGKVLSLIDQTHWVVVEENIFGRLSTAVWALQFFLPFLATVPANRAIARLLSKRDPQTRECMFVLRRRKELFAQDGGDSARSPLWTRGFLKQLVTSKF